MKKFEKVKTYSYKLSQQTFVHNNNGFKKFCNISIAAITLGKYVQCKVKHVKSNQILFMTKDLPKNNMKISQLRNEYLK